MDDALHRPVVACVLKSGGDYDAEYVTRLRDGFQRHLPIAHRFICFSDVDVPCERVPLTRGWPGWWSKFEVFAPDLEGDILLADLDTVVVGDVSTIAGARDFTMIRWGRAIGSGLMMLPAATREYLWQAWIRRPEAFMQEFRGDQEFIIPRAGIVSYWPESEVVSYKRHCRNGVPEGAKVVCFHGQPRPRDIGWKI